MKALIEYQCTQELKASKLWKVSTYFMQEQNKIQLQAEVCNCVGEHALKYVPAQTILKSPMNEEAKNQLTRQALSNTLKVCIYRINNSCKYGLFASILFIFTDSIFSAKAKILNLQCYMCIL